MRFEQTHEILDHIRQFHQQLSDCYRQLEQGEVRDRTRMLADYLVNRESELSNALQDFAGSANPEILDTWFQFADESKLVDFTCPVISSDCEVSMENILMVARQGHDYLLSTFNEIIEASDTPAVRDVFEKLRDQAETQWHKLTQNINMLSDI